MKKQNGFTLVFAMYAATAIFILLVVISKSISTSSHEMTYYNSMASTADLAETGMNKAMGELTVDPQYYLEAGFSAPHTSGKESYRTVATRTDFPVPSCYYLITTATRTVNGKPFAMRLHTYARISNVGDYFAAINGALTITEGVNVSGKVFGQQIFFPPPSGITTHVFAAEYVQTFSPDPLPANVVISTPVTGLPVKLNAGLVFPQVLDGDILRYSNIAHIPDVDPANRHDKCNFTTAADENTPGDTHIFPPGYSTPQDPLDKYAKHKTVNADHIYYCAGDMRIKGTIHGQILFVSGGDIYLSSSVVSALVTDPLPGAGSASSSTAHQPIFITRGKIYIDNTFVPGVPAAAVTEKIEGLFLAPNGELIARAYASPLTHDRLNLQFRGSIILSSTPNLSAVFRGTRSYAYMDTLKTSPPPYLPSLYEVFYQFEEILSANMY